MSERRACRLVNLLRGTKRYIFLQQAQDPIVPTSFEEVLSAFSRGESQETVPYRGYLLRKLTSQGPDALGGGEDYEIGGRMIGGFAIVAWPAEYGISGVETLLFSHRGVIYEKDLGPHTGELAARIKCFNPDKTWRRVEPER